MERFLGLRSLIYPSVDLNADKLLWKAILGKEPYFDEEFYVGFDMNGYELGLHPEDSLEKGPISYVGVANVPEALEHLVQFGATILEEPVDVGGGIIMGSVTLPNGLIFGVIDNPHFKG